MEFLEERQDTSAIERPTIPGYDDDVVMYHCNRMAEAGIIDVEKETSRSTPTRIIRVYPFGLTWEGHEFLEAMRRVTVRTKVRERLGGALSDAPFAVVKELAMSVLWGQLGLG